ncbi:hypothetical protein [Salmon gill poxvirus]
MAVFIPDPKYPNDRDLDDVAFPNIMCNVISVSELTDNTTTILFASMTNTHAPTFLRMIFHVAFPLRTKNFVITKSGTLFGGMGKDEGNLLVVGLSKGEWKHAKDLICFCTKLQGVYLMPNTESNQEAEDALNVKPHITMLFKHHDCIDTETSADFHEGVRDAWNINTHMKPTSIIRTVMSGIDGKIKGKSKEYIRGIYTAMGVKMRILTSMYNITEGIFTHDVSTLPKYYIYTSEREYFDNQESSDDVDKIIKDQMGIEKNETLVSKRKFLNRFGTMLAILGTQKGQENRTFVVSTPDYWKLYFNIHWNFSPFCVFPEIFPQDETSSDSD